MMAGLRCAMCLEKNSRAVSPGRTEFSVAIQTSNSRFSQRGNGPSVSTKYFKE